MREEIVSLDQVCLAYEKKITEPISLAVAEGEILVLAGESGSGKTSVLRAILGLPELRVEVMSGSISYREKELIGMRERERQTLLGTEITMIFQNPGAAFNPIRTYQKQLVDMLKSRRQYRGKQSLAEICSCLESLNLPDAERILASCPCELSGGMNQRMAIAAAMLLRPRLLLADEPTSALDVTVQAQILQLLKKLQETENLSILLVTHDLGVVAAIADRVAVMYQGEIVECGETENLFKAPKHPYTKALLQAHPAFRYAWK